MRSLSVIWRAGNLLFATAVNSVIEVLPPLAWSPTPGVPPWVRGLFSHRGRLIPLVDASGLLGVPTRPDRLANRVLIVRCDFGSDAPISTAGLWVRGVIDLERLDFSSAGSHPGFATDSGRFLGPIVPSQWGQVQLVKPADLFTPEQAAVLTERLKPEAA